MKDENNNIEVLTKTIQDLSLKYDNLNKDINEILTKVDFLEKLFFTHWQGT